MPQPTHRRLRDRVGRPDILRRAVGPVLETLERRQLLSASIPEGYGALPMSFEQNVGQTDAQVDFLARGSGYALFLTGSEAVMSLAGPDATTNSVIRMQIVGGDEESQVVAVNQLSGRSNYLIGEDPAGWHTDISNYGRVEYRDIYAGIDLAYLGNQQQLQYDFIVNAGASVGAIQLNFEGADAVSINADGELVLSTASGELRHRAPFIYQDINGVRQQVTGGYVINEQGQVGFTVGAYDASRTLVIDPTLVYSTFLGGSGQEEGFDVQVDGSGNAYVTGFTLSSGFPTISGGFDTSLSSGRDVFVSKLNAAGTALIYSTFIGGSGDDEGRGIAVDGAGNAYVTGLTLSTGFPTLNAFDSSQSGGRDAFLVKLNAAGSALLYSTFFGGGSDDEGRAIVVDGSGNAYITGYTDSDGLASGGAADTTRSGRDAFVAKFNTTTSGASSRVYASYLGGGSADEGFGIAVDGSGNAYLTGFTESSDFTTSAGAFDTSHGGGRDAFVTKFNAAGTARLYSTYLGGSSLDEGRAIALDSSGNAYVAGTTESSSGIASSGAFDTSHNGGRDIFVAKLDSTGATRVYGSYLGGSSTDEAHAIAVDGSGNVHLAGFTESSNFSTFDAIDTSHNGGRDVIAAKLNSAGSGLLFSTYLGGSNAEEGRGLALDSAGAMYVAGYTMSSGFPIVSGSFDTGYNSNGDAFILKIGGFQAANTAPTANAQTASTSEDADLTITLTATDPDAGQTLSLKISTLPTNGALYQWAAGGTRGAAITVAGTTVADSLGRVVFAPDANENGTPYATFQFTATDNATPPLTSAAATVTVNVTAVNDAPSMAVDNASVAVNEGQTAANTGTWSDIDSGGVTLTASVGAVTKNADGTWSWSFTSTDGPDQSQTVTITANDGTITSSASFALAVNNVAPTVTAGSAAVAVNEGQTAANSGTWSDPGADVVTLSASKGTVVKNADGTWSWSFPSTDGPDDSATVTITATDSDGASTSTSFSLAVNNVPPTVAAANATVTVNEGQPASNTGTWSDPGADVVTLTASVGNVVKNANGTWSWSYGTTDGPDDSQTVTITATDSDGASSSTTFALAVSNVAPSVAANAGAVSVNEGQAAGNTGTWSDPGADTVSLSASVGTVTKNADGTWSWSFTSTDGPDQSQSVVITATDSDGAATTTSFALTVNNVAPSIENDGDVTVNEGQTATNAGSFSDPGNDTVSLWASAGTVTDNGDGTWSWSFNTTDGPDDGATVTITATDSDGAATSTSFSLAVNNVAPSVAANAASVTVDEGQTATNTGTWSDPGADVVTLTASKGTVVKNADGTWSWSFASSDGPDDSATVTITATDSDGAASTTTFSLVVNNVAPAVAANSASVTVDEGQTAGNTGTWSDPGADTVSLSASVGAVTKNPDGTWSWSFGTTDGPDQSQTVTITATDSDGDFTTTTFDLTVANVAPSVTADSGSVTVSEGQTAVNTGTWSDPGADVVTLSASAGTVTKNANGTWSWSFSSTDGPDDSGTVTITATDSDGAVTTTTFALTVQNVAPTVTAGSGTVTVNEGQTAGNAGNWFDPGADVVSLSASKGTVTKNADGTWTWSFASTDGPDDSATVTITATDSDGASTNTSFALVVQNVAPTATNNAYTLNEDGSIGGNVISDDTGGGADSDPAGAMDPLNMAAVNGQAVPAGIGGGAAFSTSHGTVTVNPDGSFTYTPDADYFGTDSFTYTISDDDGATHTATVTLTIAEVNDAPVAADDSASTNEDNAASGSVLGNDTDADNTDGVSGNEDVLTVSLVSGPAHGTLVLNADGSYTYTPHADYFGPDSFTYQVSDGRGGTDTATMALTVAEINDAPLAVNDTNATSQDSAVTGNVLANDSDPDNLDGVTGNEDTLVVSAVNGSSAGVGAVVSTFHGTVVVNADGSYTYTPDLGYAGSDSFTYTVSDGRGGTATATVALTIAAAAPGSIYIRPDLCGCGPDMLVINGTGDADSIHVSTTTDGGLQVTMNGVVVGTYFVTGRIVIFGYAGNDHITLAGSVPNVTWLYGDAGDDLLNLGNGGGIAWGGDGSDHINGGSGRDILIGGQGADRIVGNPGDDILAAGLTMYDDRFSADSSHQQAWCAISKEWMRTDLSTISVTGDTTLTAFEQRVEHLKGIRSGGYNGGYFLNTSTLIDDMDVDDIDMLTGSAGEDWFLWTRGEDRVNGMSGAESEEDIDTVP